MKIGLTLAITSLILSFSSAYGQVSSFGSDKAFSGRTLYVDQKTGTEVLELTRVPSRLFSWTSLGGLDGILAARNRDGTFGNFKNYQDSSFVQNFPQALVRHRGLLFNSIHPLNFSGGVAESYGNILMKILLKKDRAIQAVRLDKKWKTQEQAFGALITGDFDFRQVDLVYNSYLDEWIILNPAIIEDIIADPEILRPELDEWIRCLQQPDFKPPEGYLLKEGLFSFSSPDALVRRVDTVLQIEKLYSEYGRHVQEILVRHQISAVIPMKKEISQSLTSVLSAKLGTGRSKTQMLAALIPSWSDIVTDSEAALFRIQRENSDLMLVQIAMNLGEEPLAEKIWNILTKKILSNPQNVEIKSLYRSILGIDIYMVGVKFALRLLTDYSNELKRNPELLSIFLETKGYLIIDVISQLDKRLEELSATSGEPWVTLRSVIVDAKKARSSNQEAARNFRARLGLKTPVRLCKDLTNPQSSRAKREQNP